jgi:hypothetical protein
MVFPKYVWLHGLYGLSKSYSPKLRQPTQIKKKIIKEKKKWILWKNEQIKELNTRFSWDPDSMQLEKDRCIAVDHNWTVSLILNNPYF